MHKHTGFIGKYSDKYGEMEKYSKFEDQSISAISSKSREISLMADKSLKKLHQPYQEEEEADIIKSIDDGSCFPNILVSTKDVSKGKFDQQIKVLKKVYEDKLNLLKNTLIYVRMELENHYKLKISLLKEIQMNSADAGASDKILFLTEEHSKYLKNLRRRFDETSKKLEQSFFATLKEITPKNLKKDK